MGFLLGLKGFQGVSRFQVVLRDCRRFKGLRLSLREVHGGPTGVIWGVSMRFRESLKGFKGPQ